MYNKEVAKTGAKCPFFLKFMSCKKANMENLFGHTVVDIICDVTVCWDTNEMLLKKTKSSNTKSWKD